MNETQQTLAHIALAVLSKRALLLVGLILDFTLFLWTLSDPSLLRLIAASAFGVLVLAVHWLPVQT